MRYRSGVVGCRSWSTTYHLLSKFSLARQDLLRACRVEGVLEPYQFTKVRKNEQKFSHGLTFSHRPCLERVVSVAREGKILMSLWEAFHSKATRQNNSRLRSVCGANPLCEIDIHYPFQHVGDEQRRRRSYRQKLGEKIARQKAVCEPRTNDRFKDGSTVVYRRQEDWSNQQSYVNCIFLDQHDTVVACDLLGKVDIVRLPIYGHSEKPRVLGTCLARELEIHPAASDFSNLKLKSIRNGNAICVGMPSGNYHVLTSDRTSTWGDKFKLPQTSFSEQHNSSTGYISRCWSLEGPRRRYCRNRQNSLLALTHLIQGERNSLSHDRHEFAEMDHWNAAAASRRRTPNRMRFVPHQRPANDSAWDFFETPSSLFAAHVDSEHDCFWLRLLDDRIQRSALCIDTTSHDRAPMCEEHVTSCAFASENCLATSHVWCRVGQGSVRAASVFEGGQAAVDHAEISNCVKLWDLRMIRSEKPLKAIILPAFPNEKALPSTPHTTLHVSGDEFGWSSITSEPGHSHHVITKLDSSNRDRGTLVVTTQSRTRCRETEHYVLDLKRHCFTRRVLQTNQSTASFPVHGVAASHNYMACLSGDEKPLIHVWNLHETSLRLSKKRKANGSVRIVDDSEKWESCFYPDLTDRHGLQTQLSCLAMNESGTAILGGSNDGDLFVWRGV